MELRQCRYFISVAKLGSLYMASSYRGTGVA